MGDFSDYSSYSLSRTGVASFGHVPYYNSLNVWMNKPSMTSSSPSSVIMTSSYVPRQAMSDLGTFGGLHRMGTAPTGIQPPENHSHSGIGYQKGMFTAKQPFSATSAFFETRSNEDRSRVLGLERYSRWRPQGIDPVTSNLHFFSLPTKPVSVFQAQPLKVTEPPSRQGVYKYLNDQSFSQADDSMTSEISSKEKSQLTSISTSVLQKPDIAENISGRNANIYVPEPHRTVKPEPEIRNLGIPPASPTLVSQSVAPQTAKPPASDFGNFSKSSGIKTGVIPTAVDGVWRPVRRSGQDEERVLQEIDDLYGKINPPTRTKGQDQVNADARLAAPHNRNHQSSSSSSSSRSQVPIKSEVSSPPRSHLPTISEDSSFPRSQLPRTEVSPPSVSSPPPQRSDGLRLPRSQLPRTEAAQPPTPSRVPPSSNDPGPARSQLPRTNLGRNQPTVGHRMLRDVLRGRNRPDQSATTPPIDERKVVHDAFRFLDDFDD